MKIGNLGTGFGRDKQSSERVSVDIQVVVIFMGEILVTRASVRAPTQRPLVPSSASVVG